MLQIRLGLALLGLVPARVFAAAFCVTIMDPVRMPLPSASINAINLATGKSHSVRTNASGAACISGIPEGLYSIEASLQGFLHVRYYPVRLLPLSKQTLSFTLPLGDITEGGMGDESTLSGTLIRGGVPVQAVEICLTGVTGSPRTCTVTNELGEYALVVPVGEYQAEVNSHDGEVIKSKLDLAAPGTYRNRLTFDAHGERH